MDLSVDKIRIKNNLNFKGVKGQFDEKNEPVYKFIAPPHSKNEKVALQVALLYYDEANKSYDAPEREGLIDIDFNSDDTLSLNQDNIRQFSDGMAYRYKITDKNGRVRYVTDHTKTIGLGNENSSERLNYFEQGKSYVISPKTGPMKHSFLDADAIIQDGALKGYDKDFVRNHFNKLGGSIKGLTYLLKNTDELDSYRYIISTPDIGNDKVSSHGYWPNNQYQCKNLDDFKEFVFELYKKGKGYVADGAFTSQGFESPLFQHVLRWGEDSPYYHYFKLDGAPNIGVLPDRSREDKIDSLDFVGVRLVNSPKYRTYQKDKPTYMQFYDTRLVSDEQLYSNRIIEAYDKAPEDHFDITSYNDSVLPYYFELDPKEDKDKLKKFDKNGILQLKDIKGELDEFLTFPHYKIVSRNDASGANFWDGNRDIIKMNLSNPLDEKADRIGFENARNYLFGVASYWSETIQSDLILKTALMNEYEKHETALNNGISEEEYANIKVNLDSMRLPVLEENKTIHDYVKEFPVQQIETQPDLNAVLSEADFNKEFLETDGGRRLETIILDFVDEITPKLYRDNGEYKAYLLKAYAPAMIKAVMEAALCGENYENGGYANPDVLTSMSIPSLIHTVPVNPEDERKLVIDEIQKNVSKESAINLVKDIKEEVKNISLEDFKMADAIVLKGRAGLNWRFDATKDIGDMDGIRDNAVSFDKVWDGDMRTPGVVDFWQNFISNVKKYNPSAYIISEVTCLGELMSDSLKANQKETDFLNKVGSTTSSNYTWYFNSLANFAGADAEKGDDQSGLAGNLGALKGKVQELLSNVQSDNAMLSHMFTDNHDKPRLMHALAIDMNLFHKGNISNAMYKKDDAMRLTGGRTDYLNISSRAVAVGLLMEKTINQIYRDDEPKKQALLKSLENLVNGKKDDNSENNFKRADAFGSLPLEVTGIDLFKNSGIEYTDDDLVKFQYEMKKEPMKIQVGLWEMMNAIVGTPTLYYGTDFAQTGFETPSKNVHVANRNQAMRELKDVEGFSEFYTKMNAVSSMYKLSGLSALRDGFAIPLAIDSKDNPVIDKNGVHIGAKNYFKGQIEAYASENAMSPEAVVQKIKSKLKDKDEYDRFLSEEIGINNENKNHDVLKKCLDYVLVQKPVSYSMWPIYKYDENGSKVISVITNNGLPHNKNAYEAKVNNENQVVHEIPIKDDSNHAPLEDGMILKHKVYDGKTFVDEDRTYMVKNGTICAKDGKPFILNETVETFYVPKTNPARYASALYNGAH